MRHDAWVRSCMAACALGACFLLNPLALGCGDEAVEGYSFGASEMADVVVGQWSGNLTYEGAEVAYTLTLEPAPVDAQQTGSLRQHLCGNRTLIASADACIATSQFDVVGELSVGDEQARAVEGSLVAYGRELDEGELTLYGRGEVWIVPMRQGELGERGEARDQDDRALLGEFSWRRGASSD